MSAAPASPHKPIGNPAAAYRPDESFALDLDRQDPLRAFREQFHVPTIGEITRPANVSLSDGAANAKD